jgi:hypothetical protein
MSKRRTKKQSDNELFVTEKIEAYNIAIEALRNHEPADGDPSGIAKKLRHQLADKLDREIQKWCDANL